MPLRLPKVRADLEYFEREIEGEDVIVVRDPVRGTYFKYNPLQAAMLRSLDGVRSLDEMVAALSQEFEVDIPRVSAERFVAHARKMLLLDIASYAVPDARVAKRVLRALARHGLQFRDAPPDETAATSAEAALFVAGIRQLHAGRPSEALDYFCAVLELDPGNWRARTLVDIIQTAYIKALSGATSDFPTFLRFNPTAILGVLDRTLGAIIFRWPAWLLLLGLMIGAVYSYSITSYPDTQIGAIDIVLLLLLNVVRSFVHELGHGLACYHYGGAVPEMGCTLFYYIRILPYCDTSSSYLFRNRNHQVAVQLAGSIASLILVCLMFIGLAVIRPSTFIYQAAQLLMWISLVMMFVNFIPFLKFDGYYALCDLWGVPNLRERSMKLLKAWLGARLLGVAADEEALTSTKRRQFFWFALLSSIFTALWIYWVVFRLLAPMVERFRGAGLVISLAIIGYLLRGVVFKPLGRLGWLVVRERHRIFTLRRTAVLVVLLAGLVGPWMIETAVRVDAEFVLVPTQRVDIRAQVPGLIERILVREGEPVRGGQALVVLRNDELAWELRTGEAELDELDAQLAEVRRGPRSELIRLVGRELDTAQAALTSHARRAAVAGILADAGLGTGAEAAAAASAAAVSLALRDVARTRLATLEAGARPEDVAAAEARRARLVARLDHVRGERARLVIRSPIDGVVVTKHLEDRRHARVDRGDSIVEVHDTAALIAEIRLPASAPLGELARGDRIVLRAVGTPDENIACTLSRIREVADAPGANDPIVRRALEPSTGDIIAVSTPFAAPVSRAGMIGHARLYGRRRSLAYSELYLPLARVFRVELWGML